MMSQNSRLNLGDQDSIRHGKLKKSSATRNILRALLTAALVFVLSGVSVAAYAGWDLWSNVKTVSLSSPESSESIGVRSESIDGAFAIALIGSDTREGQVGYNDGVEGELNDVNILLYVDESHKNATIVSFSRDMMVPIPSCPGPNGEEGWSYYETEAQLNTALDKGGLVCAVRTLEELTGLQIPYAGLITFDGVINMSNAIGGVDVCLTQPIYDENTDLNLEAGIVTLKGTDALQFLRTRYGVGDGGDASRIGNQQIFMSSMVRQLQSAETLGDPMKVYRLAKAAVENMQLSDSLIDISVMQSMAIVLKDLDLERINFVQFPITPHPYDTNRYSPDWFAAEELLEIMRSGQPFEVSSLGTAVQEGSEPAPPNPGFGVNVDGEFVENPELDPNYDGSIDGLEGEMPTPDPSAPVKISPNVTGQSAAQETCSQGRTVW